MTTQRAKPGTRGEGKYYRILVRPKKAFVTFRYQDVGRSGHLLRLAGRRPSGSWDTQAWLVGKEEAHLEGSRLVAETSGAKGVLEKLGSSPVHVTGDIFRARPRRDIPEAEKPTAAQRRARSANIHKAQAARQRRRASLN